MYFLCFHVNVPMWRMNALLTDEFRMIQMTYTDLRREIQRKSIVK